MCASIVWQEPPHRISSDYGNESEFEMDEGVPEAREYLLSSIRRVM